MTKITHMIRKKLEIEMYDVGNIKEIMWSIGASLMSLIATSPVFHT